LAKDIKIDTITICFTVSKELQGIHIGKVLDASVHCKQVHLKYGQCLIDTMPANLRTTQTVK